MKKLFACVMVLALALCAAAMGEGTTEAEIKIGKVTGSFADGAYVLTVELNPEEAGEWKADEMAQDDSVVKLASAEVRDGVFTARYEPAGDGEISVYLRHFNEHACDRILGFDLRVRDGKVQEVTGGSELAAPAEADVDPFFSGQWLEKDTQFTALDVTKNDGDGWQIEITSPVSHGAWVIRANVYFDCDYDGFVYSDGVRYELNPEDGTAGKETEKELWGTLRFTGTQDSIQLVWNAMEESGTEEIIFEQAPKA